MSGYVEAGYVVVLSTLALYAVGLLAREKVARARLQMGRGPQRAPADSLPPTVTDGANLGAGPAESVVPGGQG